ncbi:hypothetical protein P280DRAFT_471552 [Massarina eburnea CBS 473.64]|uniref:NIMA interactive protein n=1 Tax=Massarina eburnea CBS 473.64 TaxID=1395130 RepID=A0A6A6RSW4_9PLEO|nr:hypothetical protein P280DRAFT_471552 [Massarina eburnea CBS 473.64]
MASSSGMDAYNLKTASVYINNLLLARGLVTDGKPIQFAHPSRGEGGKEVTMAQIINLVHSLVLKRDRDQEHRESIAGTLRAARDEATKQSIALEKLQTRNDDLTRQLSLAQSQERSVRAALRTAESTARGLREEMVRLKTTVQQVRTGCTNDIRKRDVQIQKLKSHLTTQQRGNKTGLVGASITINPGATGLGGMAGSIKEEGPDVDDPEYSLKQETTEFLTQLSQSLSDENDNLIGLVRTTITTLKDLQGMPEEQREHDAEGLSTIGEEEDTAKHSMLQALPTSYEMLASDLDTVLDNLKHLLTNPNFVSLDEVESRDEEIYRLRAGWEKMELRLREAFTLMETWRSRMASGGDTINLDELRLGIGLGNGLQTDDEDISVTEDGQEEDDSASSVFDEDLDDADRNEVPEKTTGADMFNVKLQPNPPALRERHMNMKSPAARSPRKVAFSASIPNTPSEIETENAEAALDLVGVERRTPTRPTPQAKERTSRATPQDNRISRATPQDNRTPRHEKKRSSSPHAHPDEPSPKLSVRDKLKAAQAEAQSGYVAEGSSSKAQAKQAEEEGGERERRRPRTSRSPAKKTRIGGRPKRRQSTLTAEELDNLLLTR